MGFLKRVRQLIAPDGTSRERLYVLCRGSVVSCRDRGIRVVWPRVKSRIAELVPRAKRWVATTAAVSYAKWIEVNEPGKEELERQRNEGQRLRYRPLVSIITPVFNPGVSVLRETIESVVGQTYGNWELNLVNGGSRGSAVRRLLDKYADRDPRIRVAHLERNLGISGNSNRALEMSHGDYVCLLDHDDLLAPHLLFEVVRVLNEHPDTDVVYFDEDKISADGSERREPWFKPHHPSMTLALSTNFLMHSVVRRSLVEKVGRFDEKMDGAQDWDLALRLLETTAGIRHIPQVLYHWRQIPGSAASDANAKPWVYEVQKRCVEAHLERTGCTGARVEFPRLAVGRVVWPPVRGRVSIIIPNRNKGGLLRACLKSIFEQTTYRDYEVLIVDNGSTEGETLAYYKELVHRPGVRLVHYDQPFNYSEANNLGVRHALGENFIFLNNDTEVLEPAWIEELVGLASRPRVGVVGAKLIRPDGTIQHGGIIMGIQGHGSHLFDGGVENAYGIFGSTEWYREVMAVTGACMLIRREVYERLGGMDEGYRIGYGDIDLCLRARDAGYLVAYSPFARLLHHEGGTRGLDLPPADVLRASMRMIALIREGDPHFNPNLSSHHRIPTLAHPEEERREDRVVRILHHFGLVGSLPKPWTRDDLEGVLPRSRRGGREKGTPLLLVSHDLSLSGAPMILKELAAYLDENGYDVTVASPVDGPLKAGYEQRGLEAVVVPDILEDARVAYRFMKGFDAVLVNTVISWRAVHTAKALQIPCVWWIHESRFGREFVRSDPRIAMALREADELIFPSRETASHFTELSNGRAGHTIHYGLNVDVKAQYEDPIDRCPGKTYVMLVGSIERRKGQDVLLDAIEAMPAAKRHRFEFILIGRVLDNRYCEAVRKRAACLGNVKWVGEMPQEKVMAYLNFADILVLASRDEALPIVVLEAMHHGKAIVTTRAGGVAEVIDHGVQGLVVDVEDARGMAGELIRLSEDEELRARLGRCARLKAEQYLGFERFASEMGDVIGKTAAPRREQIRSQSDAGEGPVSRSHSPWPTPSRTGPSSRSGRD